MPSPKSERKQQGVDSDYLFGSFLQLSLRHPGALQKFALTNPRSLGYLPGERFSM